MLPRVFIGSSSESLAAAKALKAQLAAVAIVSLWAEDVFAAAGYTLDDLLREAEQCDLAMLLFTPDDLSASRDALKDSVRDNVVLEYGLFTGRLGRQRCYFIIPERSPDLRIPSDLAGITALTYNAAVFKADQAVAFHVLGDRLREIVTKQTSGGERRSLGGSWTQCWNVIGSENYPEENQSPADVLHVGDYLRAQWTSNGDDFILEGRIDDRIVTGTWRNRLKGAGYTGAFQLTIATNGKRMTGKWVGHREVMTEIEAGVWRWERQ